MEKLIKLAELAICGYSLEVNPQKTIYASIKDYLENNDCIEQIDEKDLLEILKRDILVEIIIYPRTPVCSYYIAHYDIEKAIDEALTIFEDGKS